jgi:hypothetical protein
MDPGAIGALVPIAGILTWGAIKIAKIKAAGGGTDPDSAGRLQALEDEVGHLRQDLAEAQERLDFAERLLGQQSTARVEPPR